MTPEEQRVTQLCDDLLAQHDPKSTPPAEFLGAQYDRGIAWVHFPEGSGGLGLSPKLQNTINGKLFGAGAPIPYARNPIVWALFFCAALTPLFDWSLDVTASKEPPCAVPSLSACRRRHDSASRCICSGDFAPDGLIRSYTSVTAASRPAA